MDKYRVTWTPEERVELEGRVAVGTAAARTLTPARILRLADARSGSAHDDDALVAAWGTGPRPIARVRQRFVTAGFQAAFHPRPQPPRPDTIKIQGNLEQPLVPPACSEPPRVAATGPCNGWRMPWWYAVCSGRSAPRACARLSKNDLQPWSVATWCVPPAANAAYVWRMEDVIQTYLLPYDPR